MSVPTTETDEGRWVLVLGATGNQGGTTARHLLARGTAVHAFVRDPQAPRARELSAAGATLVQGDLEDADSVRAAMRGAHGVFSVQTPLGPGGVPAEERHGLLLADIAAETGVAHYVHSSVGGAEEPAGVFWREAKLRIEERVRERGLPATFLRPTYFMDNLNQYPPLLEEGELVYRRGLEPGKSLQMIASEDIGFFAAEVFADPERFIGAKLEIAGDELTGDQIAAAFQKHTGITTRYDAVPMAELRATSEWQATAYDWLNRIGYHADIADLRRRHPGLLTLEGWLARTGWAPAEHHVAPAAAGVPKAAG
ncbi:NmrA/HSCARG family protein [Kitasatospora herbaricolor]|uniref:NmrA/HSCARG family protein n=1 Tax=Kitasatospora herbaricolor TaxID=68217 RepID=A0ABZ1WCV4_9ACTN|nr:NmrA/HSCARG family protein [Kitasatospora herbaricolor]